ncbi:MAG: endonuclease III [Acutalibacteraceae bacterium]
MTDKQRALKAIEALKKEYPDAICSLVYDVPLQLLIATRLAAQCTDARVNMVTPALFERFKTVDDFASAEVSEVEEYIKSCGLYKTKARDIVAMAKALKENFGGVVPDTIEQLVTLPGIGRKTANLVVGDIFHKSAVVVDTHCIRLTSRLGFHSIKDPVRIEKILREILPPEESNDFCHRLVLHGRAVCQARNPKCEICCMKDFCPTALKKMHNNEKGD